MGHLDWNYMDARLGAVAMAALLLCGIAPNVAAQTDATKAAVTACEAEVTETVHQMRPRDAQQLEFIAAKRVLVPTQDDEIGVKGEGRYRRAAGGSVSFSWSRNGSRNACWIWPPARATWPWPSCAPCRKYA